MHLTITHVTTYRYDTPVAYALQRLRLHPETGPGQTVLEWETELSGAKSQLIYHDQFSNHTELARIESDATAITITNRGRIETSDIAGIVGKHRGFTPLWLFQNDTERTAPGPQLRVLARRAKSETQDMDEIAALHHISAMIGEAVRYETGKTDSDTLAEEALAAGHGVCQDHAQIMISVARVLGHPARYVSGYLFMNDRIDQDAGHAWCEVWTQSLGWVGFDVSNGISPDDRYVRIATGRDYRDAAPVLGLRHGDGAEQLQVSLQVQQ